MSLSLHHEKNTSTQSFLGLFTTPEKNYTAADMRSPMLTNSTGRERFQHGAGGQRVEDGILMHCHLCEEQKNDLSLCPYTPSVVMTV